MVKDIGKLALGSRANTALEGSELLIDLSGARFRTFRPLLTFTDIVFTSKDCPDMIRNRNMMGMFLSLDSVVKLCYVLALYGKDIDPFAFCMQSFAALSFLRAEKAF